MLRDDVAAWWDGIVRKVAWRLPRRIVFWAVIRASLTVPSDAPLSGHTVLDVLDAWEHGRS